ncbi:Hemicentin-1 [Gossypium arboreum]|uniref:Hemicentin-1 n=1 Tax=Gossypium arboreum TaxID=29729 RepID=A0A0B0PWB1_GOSAR|nr:Hemicentin-1 [Gossypium arboreum]
MKDIKAILSSGIIKDRHHTIEPYFGTLKKYILKYGMLTQIGVASWLFKWPIFVHNGTDTGVCFSRVRHTVTLHNRVSPGVPYELRSVYPPFLTWPRHTYVSTGRVRHTSWHTGVWLAVWPSQ